MSNLNVDTTRMAQITVVSKWVFRGKDKQWCFDLINNIRSNEVITMLSYVLFSYAAFDFPIHTLRLLHSLALASQLTLYTVCIRSLRLLN